MLSIFITRFLFDVNSFFLAGSSATNGSNQTNKIIDEILRNSQHFPRYAAPHTHRFGDLGQASDPSSAHSYANLGQPTPQPAFHPTLAHS